MSRQTLSIDFAAKRSVRSPLGTALLLGVMVLLGTAVYLFSSSLMANAQLADTLAAVNARQGKGAAAVKVSAKSDAVDVARTRAVRQVSQKLTTPWADLLDSLESAPSQSIAILSIEPSVSKKSIRITAEAKTNADMLTYLGALQHESRLTAPVLVSHQVQAQAPGTPVRFQVQAGWGAGE